MDTHGGVGLFADHSLRCVLVVGLDILHTKLMCGCVVITAHMKFCLTPLSQGVGCCSTNMKMPLWKVWATILPEIDANADASVIQTANFWYQTGFFLWLLALFWLALVPHVRVLRFVHRAPEHSFCIWWWVICYTKFCHVLWFDLPSRRVWFAFHKHIIWTHLICCLVLWIPHILVPKPFITWYIMLCLSTVWYIHRGFSVLYNAKTKRYI